MPNFEELPEYKVRGMEDVKDPAATGVKVGNGNVRNNKNEDMYQKQKSEYPLPYFYKDKNIYANIYKVQLLRFRPLVTELYVQLGHQKCPIICQC